MSQMHESVSDFHWLLDVLQTIDVGILVLDLDFNIVTWNGFMENHSGIPPREALGKNLFSVFPDIPQEWFEHKSRTVIQLRNRAFTTWEQRPYVFRFRNNRPITGLAEYMYQNCTFIPVSGVRGEVENLCVIVYDVTDVAVSDMELQKANNQLQRISRVDGLTGLFNRRFWEEQLVAEFLRLSRSPHPTSLIMFDIDHFKTFNDTYGHTAGDEVIRAVARVTRESVRESDIAGRYGGEEFAILLPDTAAEDALQMAERLRETIENTVVESEGSRLKVTVSLGVAGWCDSFRNHAEWIKRADQALYRSKERGRNRVSTEEKA
ncbi:sensor domain-containing diguanylate cyclase [Marinimicrobium alkaliphilum]|uniref:sensor domain-containing diguanylate cyclase n=1 Tax=Marinimicrobium alkaliphilum TaxID=2202654 RepID=UPI000DBA0EFE|nr:sensor domain-containing diguanylate cyclase [Marinimicrobium alkaliphilum]